MIFLTVVCVISIEIADLFNSSPLSGLHIPPSKSKESLRIMTQSRFKHSVVISDKQHLSPRATYISKRFKVPLTFAVIPLRVKTCCYSVRV